MRERRRLLGLVISCVFAVSMLVPALSLADAVPYVLPDVPEGSVVERGETASFTLHDAENAVPGAIATWTITFYVDATDKVAATETITAPITDGKSRVEFTIPADIRAERIDAEAVFEERIANLPGETRQTVAKSWRTMRIALPMSLAWTDTSLYDDANWPVIVPVGGERQIGVTVYNVPPSGVTVSCSAAPSWVQSEMWPSVVVEPEREELSQCDKAEILVTVRVLDAANRPADWTPPEIPLKFHLDIGAKTGSGIDEFRLSLPMQAEYDGSPAPAPSATAAPSQEPPAPGEDLPVTPVAPDDPAEGITAALLLDYLELPEDTSWVTAVLGGEPVDGDTIVGTGFVLCNEAGEESIVAIRGDVTGTGKIGLTQLVRLAKAVSGTEPLEGAFAVAGDLSENGKIDLTDMVQLAHLYAGISEA